MPHSYSVRRDVLHPSYACTSKYFYLIYSLFTIIYSLVVRQPIHVNPETSSWCVIHTSDWQSPLSRSGQASPQPPTTSASVLNHASRAHSTQPSRKPPHSRSIRTNPNKIIVNPVKKPRTFSQPPRKAQPSRKAQHLEILPSCTIPQSCTFWRYQRFFQEAVCASMPKAVKRSSKSVRSSSVRVNASVNSKRPSPSITSSICLK